MKWHHPQHQVLIHCQEPWYQVTQELRNMYYTSTFFFSPVPDEVAPPPAPSPHPLPGTLVSTHTGIMKHVNILVLSFSFQCQMKWHHPPAPSPHPLPGTHTGIKKHVNILVLSFSAQCQLKWHHPQHQVPIHFLEPWYKVAQELRNM